MKFYQKIISSRELNAKEALEKIDHIIKFQPKENQGIKLQINGNEIMKILELQQGPKIGKIISEIKNLIEKLGMISLLNCLD